MKILGGPAYGNPIMQIHIYVYWNVIYEIELRRMTSEFSGHLNLEKYLSCSGFGSFCEFYVQAILGLRRAPQGLERNNVETKSLNSCFIAADRGRIGWFSGLVRGQIQWA